MDQEKFREIHEAVSDSRKYFSWRIGQALHMSSSHGKTKTATIPFWQAAGRTEDRRDLSLEAYTYLADPVMTFLEKTLRPHPTENLVPYLLFSNTLSDTSALNDSIMANPASPLSWT